MAQEPDEVTSGEARPVPPNADTSTTTPTAGEIRAEIEQTRAEMSETIDAIQERLSPSRVVTNAKQAVADATVGRVKRLAHQSREAIESRRADFSGRAVLDTVEDRPVAAALAGLAAAALIVSCVKSFQKRGDSSSSATREPRPHTRSLGANRPRWPVIVGTGAGFVCWSAWRGQFPFAEYRASTRDSGEDLITGE
jgi:Protein of unknown function (DUF3618)